MRGASRASLAEARERLASAVSEPGVADALSDELFSVVGLLDSQPVLRRALTDTTRRPADRAGLVRALLEGKVSLPRCTWSPGWPPRAGQCPAT